MRKVTIMIVGQGPREVFVPGGETFLGLIKRLQTTTWPLLLKVSQWYQNSKPIDPWTFTVLRDGDILAGTPAVSGSPGPWPNGTPTAHVEIYGGRGPGKGYPLKFNDGMNLDDALIFAPDHIQKAASSAIAWGFEKDGRKYRRPEACDVELFDGITLVPHSVRIDLLGYGGSLTFPIKFGEHLGDFLVRCNLEKFPMYWARRYFLRPSSVSETGHEIHNPGHFELKPGMHLRLEGTDRRTSKPDVAGLVTFTVTGRAPKRVCFKTGGTLETLLEQEDCHSNNVYVDGRPAPEPELLLLRNGMKIATNEWL